MTDHIAPDDLSAYLDGELTPDERRAVESHLVTCQRCRDELGTLRWTVDFIRAAPRAELPPGVSFHVPDTGDEAPTPFAAGGWPLPALASVSLVIAIAVMAVALRSTYSHMTTRGVGSVAEEQNAGRGGDSAPGLAPMTTAAPGLTPVAASSIAPATDARVTDLAVVEAQATRIAEVYGTATALSLEASRPPDLRATMTAVMKDLLVQAPVEAPRTGGMVVTPSATHTEAAPTTTPSAVPLPTATARPAEPPPARPWRASRTTNVLLALAAALAAGAVAWIALRERTT